MTVADLIAHLQQFDGAVEVRLDGCHLCGTTHPVARAERPPGEAFTLIVPDADKDKVYGL